MRGSSGINIIGGTVARFRHACGCEGRKTFANGTPHREVFKRARDLSFGPCDDCQQDMVRQEEEQRAWAEVAATAQEELDEESASHDSF